MKPFDPRVLRVIPEARPTMAGLGAVGVAQGALAVAQAFAVSHLVVTVVRSGSGSLLRGAMLWVGAVLAARAALGWGATVYAARAGIRVSASVREKLLTRWLGMPLDDLGDPTARVTLATQGATTIEPYVARFLPALVGAVVLPLGVVATILTLDWVSALIVVLTVPLLPVFAALIGRATQDETDKRWRSLQGLAGHFLDVVRGLPTLVAYGRAERQGATIRQVSERHREATMATLRIAFLSSAALELLASVSVAIVAVTVGLRLTNGTMDLAAGLVCILLAPEAYWPIRRVGAEYHAAADGVAALGSAMDELERKAGEAETRPSTGVQVALTDVSYAYPCTDHAVIEGLDVAWRGPALVAVTGPSGTGKTTLLELISGARRPTGGRVDAGPCHVVSQRPLIVSGTLRDNLTLGVTARDAGGLGDERLRAALVDVGLPISLLDTRLGDDGFGLSAGQRARLALARALLSDAPVVLLDEPTAHLDPESMEVAHRIIDGLARQRLVVVVTHRPELVALADHQLELVGRPAPPPRETVEARRASVLLDRPSTGTQAAPSPANPVGREPSAPADPFEVRAPGVRGAAVLGGLATASGIALTATSGWLIVAASHQPVILTLLAVIVSVRAFGIARPVLRYAERIRSHAAALDLLARRRVSAYEALVPLAPARLGRRARSHVLTGIVDDLEDHVYATVRVRVPVIGAVVAGAVTVLALTVVMPAGALLVAAVLLAHAVVARRGHRLEAGAQDAWLGARAEIARVTSLVTGYAGELRGVGGGAQAVGWVREAHRRLGEASAVLARTTGSTVALGHLVTGAGTVGAAALASWAVSLGLSDAVAAVVVLVPMAVGDGFVGLPDAMSAWARADGSETRLRDLLSQPPAVVDPVAKGVDLGGRRGAGSGAGSGAHLGVGSGAAGGIPGLALAEVTARWAPEAAAPVDLAPTTLRIAAGEHVVITGPNGVGKSTLLAVLARALDPVAGRYEIGGIDVRELALADARSLVAIVDDEPHVFASTLRENLRLARSRDFDADSPTDGQPNGERAGDAELVAALDRAGLSTWFAGLPDGFDTMLGTGWRGVSGGERARLALARAHISGRPIVLLDEPVAHLDHATAVAVLRDVHIGFIGRTVVMVSHRPDGVEEFDRVIELGELAAVGADAGSGIARHTEQSAE